MSVTVLTLMLLAGGHGRLSAQIVINEVLADNHFIHRDEDDDSSDSVELLNTGNVAVDLAGYSISDDIEDPQKWILPPLVIDPGEFLLVWCSGKDRTSPLDDLITQDDSPLPFIPSLVSLEAQWRYLTGAPEDAGPPEGWNRLDFDDADWSTGRPGFGFGDDDDTTVLPEGIGAVFLRHRFHLRDGDIPASLVLQACYDDGLFAYLNGVRVAFANVREDEEPTFASTARRSHECRRNERFGLSEYRDLLQPGDNLLAMVLLNQNPANDDISLTPELGTVAPVLHANFKISKEGEHVVLTDPTGTLLDVVLLPPQSEDHSYGRFPDGIGEFTYIVLPTPLGPNRGPVTPDLLPEEVSFEPDAGKHGGPVDVALWLGAPLEGVTVHYTTDGVAPTASSPIYEAPIHVVEDTVIRAVALLGDKVVTRVTSRSYLLGALAHDLTLPIISISMDPEDFSFVHLCSDRHGPAAERPAHMEILDASGTPVASTGFGLRLHGGAGRGGDFATKKAYRAYFRDIHGDTKLRYPIIEDTDVDVFDRLVLRSNFNDAFRWSGRAVYIRDQLIRDLHEEVGGVVSHGSWYDLFINMEYRGVYNVVERMDGEFFRSYFPRQEAEWNVVHHGAFGSPVPQAVEGTPREWGRLRFMMSWNDLTDDALFDEITRIVDVANFTSYMIVNTWAQNHDWPQNNWYAARPQRPDGQWIFLCWDGEFGIGLHPGGFSSNTFEHILGRGVAGLTIILESLLQNRRYEEFFLAKLERVLGGALSPENVRQHIERLSAIIDNDMRHEAALTGQTIDTWHDNVAALEVFAENRNPIILDAILNAAPFRIPRVDAVSPGVLHPEGEEEVILEVRRFTAATTVLFAGVPSPALEILSPGTVRAIVPFDIRLDGTPDIDVIDPVSGKSRSSGLLEVNFVRPEVLDMVPTLGLEEGGELVTIVGRNFREGVRVEFGTTPAVSVVRVQGRSDKLEVVTPSGTGTVPVRVINTHPGDLPATTTLEFSYTEGFFRRDDVNNDGSPDISDPIRTLCYLLVDLETELPCEDALDADDSGQIDLTDAIRLLEYLFQDDSRTPAAPVGECGPDPTPDSLTCNDLGRCR